MTEHEAHPYIPNSVPEIQEEMLAEIGAASIEELYQDIPEQLRFRGNEHPRGPGGGERFEAARRKDPVQEPDMRGKAQLSRGRLLATLSSPPFAMRFRDGPSS